MAGSGERFRTVIRCLEELRLNVLEQWCLSTMLFFKSGKLSFTFLGAVKSLTRELSEDGRFENVTAIRGVQLQALTLLAEFGEVFFFFFSSPLQFRHNYCEGDDLGPRRLLCGGRGPCPLRAARPRFANSRAADGRGRASGLLPRKESPGRGSPLPLLSRLISRLFE